MSEAALIQFKVDTSSIKEYLPAKGDAIISALMQRSNIIGHMLQERVLGKLEGNPIKSHTHKLAGSVLANEAVNDGNTITTIVQAGGGPAFYAKFLEDGTPPHVIAAKDPKGALAFMIGGEMIFRKKVNHPGNKPFLFMKNTLSESKEEILASMQRAVTEAVK